MNARVCVIDRDNRQPRLARRRLRLAASAGLSLLALTVYLASCVYTLHTIANRVPQPFPLLPEQFGLLLYDSLTVLAAYAQLVGAV
jgi:hypothetical protein